MKSHLMKYLRLLILWLVVLLVTAEPLHATPPPQTSTATLHLINDSEQTICYVLISTVTASEWGEDWLGDDTIPPGQSYSFELAPGDYDVLLEDCDQNPLLA